MHPPKISIWNQVVRSTANFIAIILCSWGNAWGNFSVRVGAALLSCLLRLVQSSEPNSAGPREMAALIVRSPWSLYPAEISSERYCLAPCDLGDCIRIKQTRVCHRVSRRSDRLFVSAIMFHLVDELIRFLREAADSTLIQAPTMLWRLHIACFSGVSSGDIGGAAGF